MVFPLYFYIIPLFWVDAASRKAIGMTNMQNIENTVERLEMKFRQQIRSLDVQALKHEIIIKTLQNEVADLKKENHIVEQLMLDQQNEIRKSVELFHLLGNRTCISNNKEEKKRRAKRSGIDDQHLKEISSNEGLNHYTEDTTEISRAVAFSAYMSSDITVSPKQTLVFGHILTNRGTAYNAVTDIFTCKNAGTYVFLWTVARKAGSSLETDLVRNGEHVGFELSRGYSTYELSGSNTVILDLRQGGSVWVVVRYIYQSQSGLTSVWGRWSTFSGFLLR